MTNRCPHCGTGDHCQCALDHRNDQTLAQVRRDLGQIPDLYTLLNLFIVRGPSGEVSLGAPMGSRPPIDLGVRDLMDEQEKAKAPVTRERPDIDRMDHRWRGGDGKMHTSPGTREQGVLPTLSQWVREVDSARWDDGDEHLNPPTQRTVPGECGWLIESLDWIVEQPWFSEFAQDLASIRRDLKSAIRDYGMQDLRLACTHCGWPEIEAMSGGTWYRCKGCERSWPRAELSKMAERKRPRALKRCAEYLNVPHRTLRYLVAEGRLKHVARDGNANLYNVQDCAAAIAWVKIRESRTTSV